MYQPKISFITATFNSAKTLEQTLASVFDQSYSNIEYIIVDGGSTDDTLSIVRSYGERIRWISEPDNGCCDAVGKGIAMATGDYINILGSDDCLAGPTVLTEIVQELQDKPDILSCNRYDINETLLVQCDDTNEVDWIPGVRNTPTEGAYIGRHLFQKYPFDRTLHIVSDFKFFLQCQRDPKVRIKYSSIYAAFFRLGGTCGNTPVTYAEFNQVLEELGMTYRRHYAAQQRSWLIRMVKKILMEYFPIGIYRYLFLLKNRNYARHTCSNRICRWCHRGI